MKRLFSSCYVPALGASALLFALPLSAWQLDPERSRVSATVMQIGPDGPVPRQHEVRRLAGSADASGTLQLPLRLNQSDLMERLGPLPPWLSGLTERPMATLTTQFPPERLERLAVGDSLVEVLTMKVQSGNAMHEESLSVRFTKTAEGQVQVTNAERVALDGQALMADPTVRSVLLLLGYEQIGDEVPVTLDALLVQPPDS